MEKYIEIGGRLHSTATGNVTTGANEILDDELNKKQSQINSETLQHVESIDAALQELSPDQTQALALATDVNTLKAKSVRGDETQSLTDVEKEQAISNMGVTGVYDISGEHPVSGHPKKYSTLPAALADVPVGRRKSGMSVKALMQLTQEMYHVEVTEGVTDLPTGYNEYELSEASPMTTGDYTYSELDTENFGAIPSTVGASVLYYIYDSQSSSYTTWLLTKSSDSTYAYKQYLYMQEYANTTAGNTAFLTAANWQGVDDEPTAGSDNLVKSGGVWKELALGAVYDVSAKNPTAGPNNDGKFESLSALLSDANLNTLIPTAVRKGGMSIKFVQSSDNKYVQARLMADSFTTDITQWQSVDNEPIPDSDNLVKSGGVSEKIRHELYSLEEVGSVSFTMRGRKLAVLLSLEDSKDYLLEMSVDGLTDTDIDNLLYFRICENETAGQYIDSHTFDNSDKDSLKNTGKWEYEYSSANDTEYIQLFFTADYVPTAGNTITIKAKTDVAIYEKSVDAERAISLKEDNYLKGKTIVCFGDSITEFYGRDDNKRYSDYIADYTGATVINVGIGGTRIRERANPVIDQSAGYKDSNYAALDIVNVVRAACGVRYDENYTYLQLAQIAAEYIRDNKPTHDDNTAQIQTLAAIDWSNVDYVTVFAGTNDWHVGNRSKWGESGSHDVYTTMGAINEIINLISSTFKHIKLFWFTPIVRWIDYDGTPESMIEDNFSDYFTYDEVTLKELSAEIQREVSLNHIPVCDLYNGLGWNMDNFSEYFGYDATHPFYGFAPIARKIVDFIKSGNSNVREIVPTELYKDLSKKVDKEDGKGLINTRYVEEAEQDELIEAICDAEGKVLQGIKKDGRHVFNAGIEISQFKSESGIESGDWLDVKTDSEDKILEGINKDGEKHISKFDKSTKDLIKSFAGGSAGSNYISIPVLDANFTSPVPVEITGTKGSDDAKYVFDLPLSDDAFNIRFKFRITENLLNANKSAVIASVNNANVTATPVPLTQCVAPISFTFEGEQPLVNWPTTDGGIKFNNGAITKKLCRQHLGKEAFSVKYLGENTATIENTGSAIVLTINGVATTYSFTDYPTVTELYEAMSNNTDIQLGFVAIDQMNCSELAKFSAVTLRDTFYCDDKGTYGGNPAFDPQARIDNPPFYLRYAVSDEWHQVEIVKIGNTIYNTCDGNVVSVAGVSHENKLVLGGECGVLFKELEVYTDGNAGAEIINGFIVSDVNPYIVIFEVHGIYNGAAYTVTSEETEEYMSSMNTDTLEYIFSDLRDKGYIPVSIKDIEHYYVGNGSLPKRCYTMIFDDVRWQVCLDLECRRVFNRYGVKPALALITSRNTTIEYDGNVITKQEAANICYAAGFDIVSHTHNHRSTYGLKPSQYREWLQKDIIDADKIGADGSVIVFPGGRTDEYMGDVMEDVGIRLGIGIPGDSPLNNTLRNRFFLTRVNISRIKYADGSDFPYNTFISRIL